MTDRGGAAEAARVCPFVALDDDRDRRLDHPDHRHRCFAEGRPEPRALAHQEAFCLSPSFPGCPVFQDWARREAARPARGPSVPVAAMSPEHPGDTRAERDSGVGAARSGPTPEDAILAAGATAAAGAAATSPPIGASADADVPSGPWDGWTSDPDEEAERRSAAPPADAGAIPPRRGQRPDWAAPPPWGGGATSGDRVAGAPDASPPEFLSGREPPPDRAGPADDEWAARDERPRGSGLAAGGAAAAAAAAAAGTAPGAAGGGAARRPPPPEPEYDDLDGDGYAAPVERPSARRSLAAGRVRGSDRGDGPSWERPRRSEAYPALKNPMTLPRLGPLGAALVVLVIAALALFFVVPALLVGGPGPGGATSPSPSAGSSSGASAAPATPAAPTPQVYVIKQGDTLSKIANKFGIGVDELLAANPTTITDPNKIRLGQQIIIPVAGASEAPSAAASASPSG